MELTPHPAVRECVRNCVIYFSLFSSVLYLALYTSTVVVLRFGVRGIYVSDFRFLLGAVVFFAFCVFHTFYSWRIMTNGTERKGVERNGTESWGWLGVVGWGGFLVFSIGFL